MNLDRRGERSAFAWVSLCLAGALYAASTGCGDGSGLPSGSGWNGGYGGNQASGSGGNAGTGGGGTGVDASTGTPNPKGADGGLSLGDGGPRPIPHDGGSTDAAMALDTGSPSNTFSLLDTNVNTLIMGEPVSGFDPISEGATIDLAKVGTGLSIRANTTPAVVGSVVFVLDGTLTPHTENAVPYTMCGDNGAGTINPCPLGVGPHVLVITPYSTAGGVDGGGSAMPGTTLYFTVVDGDGGALDGALE